MCWTIPSPGHSLPKTVGGSLSSAHRSGTGGSQAERVSGRLRPWSACLRAPCPHTAPDRDWKLQRAELSVPLGISEEQVYVTGTFSRQVEPETIGKVPKRSGWGAGPQARAAKVVGRVRSRLRSRARRGGRGDKRFPETRVFPV